MRRASSRIGKVAGTVRPPSVLPLGSPSVNPFHASCPGEEGNVEYTREKRREAPESLLHTLGLQGPDPSRTLIPPLPVPARPRSLRVRDAQSSARRKVPSWQRYRTPDRAVGPSDLEAGLARSYPCDMPTTVPYPRAPLTALLETSARRFPDRPGLHALRQADLVRPARRSGPAPGPRRWPASARNRADMSDCFCRTFRNTWSRCRRSG